MLLKLSKAAKAKPLILSMKSKSRRWKSHPAFGAMRWILLPLTAFNCGYNLGDDIVYSGTCGAIFEGARIGIKGLAISADRPRYLFAAAYLDGVWDYIVKHDLFSYNPLYNVNIPTAPKDFRITKQGGVFYTDEFVHKHDDMYMQEGDVWGSSGDDPNTDINAIKENVVSITPLIATRTEMAVFEKLKNL